MASDVTTTLVPPLELLLGELVTEVRRQDAKHGPFMGTPLGRSRLALACLEDELREALEAWRDERGDDTWIDTRTEVLQIAAVALRAVRDAFSEHEYARPGASNHV